MKKILVSLVSRQTPPNILCIKEMEPMDKYVFIYTEQVKIQLKAIVDTIGIPDHELQTIPVDAISIQQIYLSLSKEALDKKDEYIINLTGGTKVMALATFQFFVDYPLARMVYLGSKDKTSQFIYPSIEEAKPLKYSMDIKEFLSAYAVHINKSMDGITFPPRLSQEHYQNFIHNRLFGKAYEVIRSLGKRVLNDDGRIELEADESEALAGLGFMKKNQNSISYQEKEYLRGKWLEEYVYNTIKAVGNLGTDDITHGLEIDYGSHNELDVFFIHKNTPYYFECKTTIKNGEEFSQSIYKMTALKNTLGIDLKLVLVVLTDVEKRFGKYFSDNPFIRAEKHNVKVIDRLDVVQGKLESYIESIFKA